MKTAIKIALLVALIPVMAKATAEPDQQLARTKELETALRLQNVTILAVRQGNYSLACKAQKIATEATLKAKVIDIQSQSQLQYAELCNMDRALSHTGTKPWWKATYGQ